MPASGDDRLLPEQHARVRIDGMLVRAGSVVQDYKPVNLSVSMATGRKMTNDPTEHPG